MVKIWEGKVVEWGDVEKVMGVLKMQGYIYIFDHNVTFQGD